MASSSGLRQAWRWIGLAATVALLGACQSGRGPDGPALPQSPAAAGIHKVALLVPLTGPEGQVSTSIANAARLALIDTGNRSIRLTVYDSAQGGAAVAASQAIAEGNELILGPLLSEAARAVAPVARRARVPVISFSNDRAAAGAGVFIMGIVPDQAIDRVVRLARERGALRFAGLVPSNLYGERAAQALRSSVQGSGGAIASVQAYGGTAASLRSAAGRLRAARPFQAVLIADSTQSAAIAAPLVGTGARLLGTELWGNDRTIGKAAALRGAWYAAVPNQNFDQLVTRYRGHYGKTPYRLASLGYDAVLLTVRASRDWTAGRPFPARRLIDREGFAGVDGIFRFGRDGVAERSLEVRQVTASGSTLLSPAATKFAD